MKVLSLKEFGMVLTGREFGHDVFKNVEGKLELPVVLDFQGVEAMGSSFGEELVIPIAGKQDKNIYVSHVNETIMSCLKDIVEENNLTLIIK